MSKEEFVAFHLKSFPSGPGFGTAEEWYRIAHAHRKRQLEAGWERGEWEKRFWTLLIAALVVFLGSLFACAVCR